MANPQFLAYVDDHQKQFIDKLAEVVAIPSCVLTVCRVGRTDGYSVSGDPAYGGCC